MHVVRWSAVLLGFLLLLAIPHRAGAQGGAAPLPDPRAAGFSVEFPKSWKVLDGGTDGLVAGDPSNEAVALVRWMDAANTNVVAAQLDKVLTEMDVEDVQWGRSHDHDLNGLQTIQTRGTAMLAGKLCRTKAIMFMSPKHKGVFLLEFVQDLPGAPHREALDSIVKSLKPIQP